MCPPPPQSSNASSFGCFLTPASHLLHKSHSMFLSRLSCSFLSRSRPPRCWASFSGNSDSSHLPQFIPAPHPWWSAQGFPPWPRRLPRSHPGTHRVFTGRTLRSHSCNPGDASGSWRLYYTTAGLMMERPDRDRGPPQKKRKNTEDKRSVDERDGHRHGGAAAAGGGKAREGSSNREHGFHDPSADRRPRANPSFGDRSQDRGRNGAGKDVSRENVSKGLERTKGANIDRQRKDSTSQDEAPYRGRREHHHHHHHHHHHRGPKESQSAESRTQTPKSKPEKDSVSVHKAKPNPWFKEGGAHQQGELRRNTKGAEEWVGHRGSDGGPWTEILFQPRNTTDPSNPGQEVRAQWQPLPPGTSAHVRQQDEAAPLKPLQRHWEMSSACSSHPQPPGCSTAFDFSVMSYNILSQELLQDNSYLYEHCDPRVLSWDYRRPNLLTEIQQHNADILCLQEVQEDHYENQIKPALQALGYQCEYKKRTGSKPDGCAIFFKSSRLSLFSSNPIEFFRSGDVVLDRDNVGLVVLLKPNSGGWSDPSTFICVANTHLLYNPRRGDVKLAQLAILLAEIGRLSRLPDGSTNPVVLCGDFNSTPGSPLYNFLTTGCLEYGGLQIGMVSGQEAPARHQRLLTTPIWSRSLGINHRCQYENQIPTDPSPGSPTAVEGAISHLSVEDVADKAAAVLNRARLEHSLTLQSSYLHRLMPDGRPEITTCHSRTAMTVDYILFTPELVTPPSLPGARGLQLLGRLSLVGQSELEEVNGLPNQHHSSDHLPLLARFRFLC
ncbi:hypothetical protein Q5P01_004637 [Channa striata]|uniref:Endonuclease/exonuclease/phosphatase domain-containing protein n=1 Tax=Channa striata TaxID=64152 RepID=A0AA88NC70_CHASR|nr:hypothetical protein Q5P01_004637 [Channa striata]